MTFSLALLLPSNHDYGVKINKRRQDCLKKSGSKTSYFNNSDNKDGDDTTTNHVYSYIINVVIITIVVNN